jgi:hypothetical protein
MFALNRVSLPASGCQQRHLAFISEYTSNVLFVPGTSNAVADALSCPNSDIAAVALGCAAIADKAPFDLKDMALCQILCPHVQTLHTNASLQIVTQKVGDLDLIDDASRGTLRPPVPRELHRQVFDHLHKAAHPGMRATRCFIASRYKWKGLSTDVTAWARALPALPTSKSTPPRPGIASAHPSTHTLFQSHSNRPGRPFSTFKGFYHHCEDIPLARSHTHRRHHNI